VRYYLFPDVERGAVREATGMETIAARPMVREEPWIAPRRRLLLVTLIGYLAWLLVFEAVGRFASTLVPTDVTLEIDRRIPFCPGMIWVYELCYLLPLVPPLAVQDGHRFNRMILAFLLANVVAFTAYLVFPVDFPHPAPGAGLSSRAVALEYAADFHPGANHLPSLHVAVAWLVFWACRGRHPWLSAFLCFAAVAISVATLFVKQHVVLDVLGGLALAVVGWILAGWLYPLVAEDVGPTEALGRVVRRVAVPGLAAIGLMVLTRAALRSVWP